MTDLFVSLTFPPHLSLLLMALATLALLLRRRNVARVMAAVGIGWSLLWSLPVCSEALRDSLERRHPLVDARRLPVVDAIVILGGGRDYRWIGRANFDVHYLKSSRVAAGARAWLAGRAPRVILSGGGSGSYHGSEAAMMAKAITQLGVPESELLLETKSRSTEANAMNTRKVAEARGIRRILLVTSAVHMPRAFRLFRQEGFQVIAFPVEESDQPRGWRRWMPSQNALWRSGRALKEHAGLFALDVQQAGNRTVADWKHGHRQPGGPAFTRPRQAQQ